MRGDPAARVRKLLEQRGQVSNRDLVERLGISSATSHRLLQGMVLGGVLERRGRGRATSYGLRPIRRRFRLPGLEEDRAWREVAAQISQVRPLDSDEEQALGYAASEVINNAVDHSEGRRVSIEVDFDACATTAVRVIDDGVGAFRKICDDFGYASAEEAISQLEKGKLTSDPERHSGEGLFFSSKVVTRFRLESVGVAWVVDNGVGDTGIGASPVRQGTRVVLEVQRGQTPRVADVFAAFTDPDTLRFMRTRATIKLSAVGRSLISRSEAKRVTARLTEFSHATLDFSGVEVVGQGFCDQVFRVFARAHPEVTLEPVGMSDPVEFLVRRSQARARDGRE